MIVVSGFYGGDDVRTLEGESEICDPFSRLSCELNFHAPTLG
jgi:hypothetical protein